MTETYKAGEIEISVSLDTSALKGEFAALNQTLAKSGQDATKPSTVHQFNSLVGCHRA